MGDRRLQRVLLTAGCTLAVTASCAAPEAIRSERAAEEAAPAAVHAVQGRRLAELMRGLERLRSARLPTAMDVGAARATREREIQQTSEALAQSARAIPAAVASVPMSDAERSLFMGMVGDLERNAAELSELRGASTEEIGAQVRRIEAACTACHDRFRSAGTIDAR